MPIRGFAYSVMRKLALIGAYCEMYLLENVLIRGYTDKGMCLLGNVQIGESVNRKIC